MPWTPWPRTAGALLASGLVTAGLLLALAQPPLPALLPGDGPADAPAEGLASAVAATFRLADAGVDGSELNVGVGPGGHIFVGGWDNIARSSDRGLTWTSLAMPLVPKTGPVSFNTNFAADRVLVVDHDTGRVLVDDTTLGCTVLHWSDDLGATWSANALACGGGVTDHQKIAVGKRVTYPDPTGLLYPNLIYVCANGLSHTNCGVSADGGLTFLPGAPHGNLCAFQGAPVADGKGVLYEPTSQCGAQVRRTADNGLTWDEFDVPVAISRDTPDLAADAAGTVYFFFTDNTWKPAFARSRDGGATWEGPFAVPVPGLVSSLFPSIVAGDAGRIALAFYATTDDKSGWDRNPGNAPDEIRWHGYVAVITDADAPAPTIAPVRVTPSGDPLQYGTISKLGSNLNNIADYIDIDVGPDGSVHAVFVDGCPATCTGKGQSNQDDAVVASQTGGPKLKA